MDTHSQKFKIRLGLFIIGGLAIFMVAIFIIGKQKNLFNPVFRLTTTFYNVSGLQVGNNVRFSGISVGTVDNIKIINDSTVKVYMLLRKDIQQFIRTDCEVSIGSEGLIGDRLLIISQGSDNGKLALDGQALVSNEPLETDAIMESIGVSATNGEIITLQLSEIMTSINSGQGTLGRLLQDTTMAENLNQTIINLKKSSQGLDENMNAIMARVEVTTTNVEVITYQLSEIMTKINSGEGTLGRLLQDTTLAENLNQTMINLKNSSQGLDENLDAVKSSFLFRGYFNKKKKAEEEMKLEAEQQHDIINE